MATDDDSDDDGDGVSATQFWAKSCVWYNILQFLP